MWSGARYDSYRLATWNTTSMAIRALGISPKATAGLGAEGSRSVVHLHRDTTRLSITCAASPCAEHVTRHGGMAGAAGSYEGSSSLMIARSLRCRLAQQAGHMTRLPASQLQHVTENNEQRLPPPYWAQDVLQTPRTKLTVCISKVCSARTPSWGWRDSNVDSR